MAFSNDTSKQTDKLKDRLVYDNHIFHNQRNILNILINLCLVNVPILYSLKDPENQRFPSAVMGHKLVTLASNNCFDKYHIQPGVSVKEFIRVELFASYIKYH